MSQSNPILRGLAITTAIAALSATGYAIYFDYQRRNSPQFRKVLRQRAKEQAKMEEQAKTHAITLKEPKKRQKAKGKRQKKKSDNAQFCIRKNVGFTLKA